MRISRIKSIVNIGMLYFFLSVCSSTNAPIQAQEVTLETDSLAPQREIKELVVKQSVLMGEQNPTTILQSISTVHGDRLLHRPVFQMESFLSGTLPGLTTEMNQGHPTSQAPLRLRGRSLMIVVDGIPRSDANIPASQIESVSVIKDGLGLAMLGMSSGNGVLYVKTKRGKRTSLQIEFTGQLAFNTQIYRPKFLRAYDYSNLLNEALANDGKPAMYSPADLELYKSGASPYTHPDVDWYNELTRKYAPIQQYNLNMSGGGRTARYFIDLNMYDQSGFLKEDKSINGYSTRENVKKYSLRSNTDISITPYTIFKANVFGQMFRETHPGRAEIYRSMHSTPSNAYPAVNPDGTIAGNATYMNNVYAQSIHSGYFSYPKTDFNIDVSLEHKFKDALDGLYVSGLYSYNSSYTEEFNRSKGYTIYSYWKDPSVMREDNQSDYTLLKVGGIQKNETKYSRLNRLQHIEFATGYDFNVNKHNSKNKILYSHNDYLVKGVSIPMTKSSVSLRSEYDYEKRYMAEVAISTMSLNQLKPGERWGWFPSLGIGWNMNRESWFSESSIDKFKLRATYGINGSDGTGSYYRSGTLTLADYYYTYMKFYQPSQDVNSGYKVWLGGNSPEAPAMIEKNLPYLTKWEKIKRLNIGLDIETFNRTFVATIEFFNNNYSDILQRSVAKDNNSIIGINIPKEHVGKYTQNGLELNLAYTNIFNDFLVDIGVNSTFYKTKLKANGEGTYPEPYMQRVGKAYGQIFGYVADGFFQSQQEIDQYLQTTKIEGYVPIPGDLKYKDLNGDGIIDGKDIKEIGTKAPRIEYGMYAGAEWRGIGFNMQWSGLANVSTTQWQYMPFAINQEDAYGQALVEHMDRWTTDNPNARYPRLSAGPNEYNERTSSFWVKNRGYVRLKNIELSYTLPRRWTRTLHMSRVKFFTNAYNLVTITSLKDRDPELLRYMDGRNRGIVPNNKAFNFGLNIQF